MSCSRTTTQWRPWGSNPRLLGLESSTLQLCHCAPKKSFQSAIPMIYIKDRCPPAPLSKQLSSSTLTLLICQPTGKYDQEMPQSQISQIGTKMKRHKNTKVTDPTHKLWDCQYSKKRNISQNQDCRHEIPIKMGATKLAENVQPLIIYLRKQFATRSSSKNVALIWPWGYKTFFMLNSTEHNINCS